MAGKNAQANAFRNMVARGSKDPQRNQQLAALSMAYAGASKPEKENFLKSFYHQCGSKGDMSAFLQQYVSNSTKQATSYIEGWFTPGQVASSLKLSKDHFSSVAEFQAALVADIKKNQDDRSLPDDESSRVEHGSSFWTSKFHYACQ
eukprot:1973613-Amphidinium_carterae.1